jgi:hypothetical protein
VKGSTVLTKKMMDELTGKAAQEGQATRPKEVNAHETGEAVLKMDPKELAQMNRRDFEQSAERHYMPDEEIRTVLDRRDLNWLIINDLPTWGAEVERVRRLDAIIEATPDERPVCSAVRVGYPPYYLPGEWKFWNTDFFVAVFGPVERLKRLRRYLYALMDGDGDIVPQRIYPQFLGTAEACIQVNYYNDENLEQLAKALERADITREQYQAYLDDPTPDQFQIVTTPVKPKMMWEQFGREIAEPAIYFDGWKYGDLPGEFMGVLSEEFPDLRFLVGGIADCGYVADALCYEIVAGVTRLLDAKRDESTMPVEAWEWELRDGVEVGPNHSPNDLAALLAVPGEEEPLGLENNIAEAEAKWQENNYGHPCEGCYCEYAGCYGKRWTQRCSGWKPGGDDTWQLDTVPTAEFEGKIAKAEVDT